MLRFEAEAETVEEKRQGLVAVVCDETGTCCDTRWSTLPVGTQVAHFESRSRSYPKPSEVAYTGRRMHVLIEASQLAEPLRSYKTIRALAVGALKP